jgi:ectoine hydroxylase-related dioxygenase (phytanoyl-CoA dioxygenase family)
MGGYDREDITLSKDEASEANIIEMSEQYGICIVDSFLGSDKLEAIRSEYETFYAEDVAGARVHTDSEHTETRYIDYDRLDRRRFEAISELVNNPLFESVAKSYFDEDDVQYPSNLWTAKSRGTPDSPTGTPSDGPPYAYHFDRQNQFKFLFYLSDVGTEDGPTHFVPEYHEEYKRYRLEWIDEGKDIWELSNVMWHYHVSDEAEAKGVPIVGSAGTLVIFDTDAPHRAGELKLGHGRQIMRIDTMSPSHSGVTVTQTDAAGRSAVDLFKQGIQNPGRAAKALSGKVLK